MIRINLLPVKRSKKRDASVRELAIGGGVLLAALIGLYVWYAVMDSHIGSADEDISKRRAEIANLEKDILKVDEFKKKKRELESKLTVIEDLKAKKTGPVKLLDELASNAPRKVWITSFEEKNAAMLIEGGAGDNDDLSDFLTYLTKRSKFFSKVALIFSEQVNELPKGAPAAGPGAATLSYVKFKMTGSASYGTLPPSDEAKKPEQK